MTRKTLLLFIISSLLITRVNALVINEILSNPVGDDNGREWVEIYNETDQSVDISGLTISIKGGAQISATPVSGGTSIPAQGYAIIGSTVSGATKFLQDYPSYDGVLMRASLSLVNTGVTSLELFLQGVSASSLLTYTAAKEGQTHSLLQGSFSIGDPTPGKANQGAASSNQVEVSTSQPSSTPGQSTLPQSAPPSADIILYLPEEKVVVVGAETLFSIYSLTRAGASINNMGYTWAFGDGGQKVGSSTPYRYLYPGRYIIQVEGTNGLVAGLGRMQIRAVAPDIMLSAIENGKYGPYITLTNPNTYDLDISGWKISVDGAVYHFPKNTLLGIGSTRFTGQAMGFASTTVSSSSIIKLLFPTMEEVVRVVQEKSFVKDKETPILSGSSRYEELSTTKAVSRSSAQASRKLQKPLATSSVSVSTSTRVVLAKRDQKDTRIASFIKTFFSR